MYDETIQDIRRRCRMAMNGVASTSMRSHGLDYKVNFGVSVMQLKELATRYEASSELAEKLWKEDNTRELKILATLLYPQQELTEEVAKRWVSETPNQEIREQLCFNLLQFYPQVIELALKCVNDLSSDIRATGYYLLSRYMTTQKYRVDINLSDYAKVWDDILSENISLKNGAKLFLQNVGRSSVQSAKVILSELDLLKVSNNIEKKEVYDSLAFEFEFFHGESIP